MVLESPRTNWKRLIKELVKGKEFAVQLQTLLQQQPLIANHEYSDSSSSAHDLILKIWTSFTEAISELTSSSSEGVFQIPEAYSNCIGDRKLSEDFGSEGKQVVKHRRGCYKRRKSLESSRMTESAVMEDGYAWRKYGQKVILNSKYPRCYYRCTYKYNQDCRATKQVQRINEDSIIYQTTYFGHHICKESQLQIITSESNLIEESLPFEAKPNVRSDVSDDVSSTLDSDLWKDLSMPSSQSAHALGENLSYFDMEEFSKFDDFHFEDIEFS